MLTEGNNSEERISLPSCYGGIGAPVGRQAPESYDPELKRLKDLERQLEAQHDEILSKDQKILALEELVRKLQQKQGDSIVPPEVDFDRLLASLQDLSELVVESDTQVTPMPGGARFRNLEPIPLKLYRNGMMMFDGPFRPFHDPSTQRCLRDILDGFFPSELQRLYPDGVPFKVSDLRNQVFQEDGLDLFPGEGRVVGRPKTCKVMDRVEETSGSRMTAEKFLNRLPKCVIRQGEVIDIRGPIRDTLQSCCPQSARVQEVIVETPVLASERQRIQESPSTPGPPLSMLRIKSENGEQTFLLMMRPTDTVGDVRTLLTQARWAQGRAGGQQEGPGRMAWPDALCRTLRDTDAANFDIFSTFPPKVYQDDALTLQAAGLVPNATLLLRAQRAQPPNPSFGSGSHSGSR
uniref:UBX domain-containing protein 11 isoform X2 n=1 Tax=Jaculus jaculus TaxID=51337 RepID=UPI001E1B60E4|nr:UBX domain-containing protein 11 isoform X2 [Jaculus jaculus]